MRDPKQLQQSRPVCLICGVDDPHQLEFHTVGGARIVLCRWCYQRLVEFKRASPPQIWEPPDELEVIGRALIAEADLLVVLAQERRRFGLMLIDRVRRETPFAGDRTDEPTTPPEK